MGYWMLPFSIDGAPPPELEAGATPRIFFLRLRLEFVDLSFALRGAFDVFGSVRILISRVFFGGSSSIGEEGA